MILYIIGAVAFLFKGSYWLVMTSDPYEGWVTEHTVEYLEAYKAIEEAKLRIDENE